MNTRFRVCGHRGRFRTRAGSSPCVSQASQHQSWAFVGWGGILGRCSTRTEAGSFFDLGMPSTFCIFDVFKLGHWGVQRVQKQVPYFSSFSMGSYGWKNRS